MNWKSRKLIVMLILFISATIFLILNKADFNQWANFNKWLFIVYGGANVISKGANAINRFKEKL